MLERFSIVPFDHRGIDTLKVDAIVLPLFQEKMQPQGAAGYFDWRLCGRLGRLIQSAEFAGATDEVMLLSYAARVGPRQLFLYGLGKPKLRPAPRCFAELEHILEILNQSKAKSVALAVPEPFAIETLCNWIQTPGLLQSSLQELIILDADNVIEAATAKIKPLLKKAGLYKLSATPKRQALTPTVSKKPDTKQTTSSKKKPSP